MNREKMSPATSDGHRVVNESVHPYQVETNRYSHEGSGYSAVASTWADLPSAIAAAKILWDGGCQRWVHVIGPMKAVYFMNGREFPNGDGSEKADKMPENAAAPEMLDALRECQTLLSAYLRPGAALDNVLHKVNSAILKAEGN